MPVAHAARTTMGTSASAPQTEAGVEDSELYVDTRHPPPLNQSRGTTVGFWEGLAAGLARIALSRQPSKALWEPLGKIAEAGGFAGSSQIIIDNRLPVPVEYKNLSSRGGYAVTRAEAMFGGPQDTIQPGHAGGLFHTPGVGHITALVRFGDKIYDVAMAFCTTLVHGSSGMGVQVRCYRGGAHDHLRTEHHGVDRHGFVVDPDKFYRQHRTGGEWCSPSNDHFRVRCWHTREDERPACYRFVLEESHDGRRQRERTEDEEKTQAAQDAEAQAETERNRREQLQRAVADERQRGLEAAQRAVAAERQRAVEAEQRAVAAEGALADTLGALADTQAETERSRREQLQRGVEAEQRAAAAEQLTVAAEQRAVAAASARAELQGQLDQIREAQATPGLRRGPRARAHHEARVVRRPSG